MSTEVENFRNSILGYIDACRQNILEYRAIGDSRAVEAAEGMIADFEMCLQQLEGTQ